MSVKNHQCTFTLEGTNELCYTHIWWNTNQHVYMIWTCLSFDYLDFHFFTQLSKNYANIFF